MLLGQTLVSPCTSYSPWVPRQADALVFAAEVFAVSPGAATLTVTVQTKNTEETDSQATNLTAVANGGATGTFLNKATGCKELVRYRYQFLPDDIPATQESINFRMLPASWLFNA